MKFKTEASLLVASLALFIVAMFFFSYQSIGNNSIMSVDLSYPYRGLALAFVGFGSISMVSASISFSRRSKTILN